MRVSKGARERADTRYNLLQAAIGNRAVRRYMKMGVTDPKLIPNFALQIRLQEDCLRYKRKKG